MLAHGFCGIHKGNVSRRATVSNNLNQHHRELGVSRLNYFSVGLVGGGVADSAFWASYFFGSSGAAAGDVSSFLSSEVPAGSAAAPFSSFFGSSFFSTIS